MPGTTALVASNWHSAWALEPSTPTTLELWRARCLMPTAVEHAVWTLTTLLASGSSLTRTSPTVMHLSSALLPSNITRTGRPRVW